MDFQSFKEDVERFESEAKTLLVLVTNPEYKANLDKLISKMTFLSVFLKDSKNIEVLKEYSEKKDTDKDNCPLDELCKDVLGKLEIIKPLLVMTALDYLRPENQPRIGEKGRPMNPVTQPNPQSFFKLLQALNLCTGSNLFRAFEILKHLAGHNKTLVILGPNGSGKTSFANYLKSAEAHVRVIPASKPIKAMGYISNIYQSTVEQYNQEINNGGDLKEDLLQKLIVGLCKEHDTAARKYYNDEIKERTTFVKVKEIFDDFFDVELDDSKFEEKEMQAKRAGEQAFPFNNMSDGERVAFFYIATVVVAPFKSFIVVDEPENHLNPAIYNKIWDRLMEVRKDCQFIFISHTMEFISARSDFELVKIKKFVYPNQFEFEFLGCELENISTDFIVEVVGSRKTILFCEGSKSDYDYKVYEALFGNSYTIIPTGNCSSVENSVVACNKHASSYSIQTAVGIIDSDLKSEEEIESLKGKKVYALECNEIEMLLLDEAIYKKVLTHLYKAETEFEAFKIKFFEKINERKQHIIKRNVKTQIDEKLRNTMLDDKANKTKEKLKENLSAIVKGVNVDEMWEASEVQINKIIEQRDYDKALKYCCLEHNEIIVGVTHQLVPDYTSIALGVLKGDAELAVHIKTKYFRNLI